MEKSNDPMWEATDDLLNLTWKDPSFNDKMGFRLPTQEERTMLENYQNKKINLLSITNGKKSLSSFILKKVEKYGICGGQMYIPFDGNQRTGILRIESEDSHILYSCKNLNV